MAKHEKRVAWKTRENRASQWTAARRVVDLLIPRVVPGKHHTIWEGK